jgi:O-antigen ligase/polysaccharide polymerase Wzy-like membrane protein
MPSALVGSRSRLRPPRELVSEEWALGLLIGALLLWLAFRDGGYFPITWNITALVLFWLVLAALLFRGQIGLGPLDAAFLTALTALTAWTLLSALWSIAPAESIFEGQRMLLYLSGGIALLLVGSRTGVGSAAVAVLAAATVVCGYALVDRLIALSPLPYNRLGGPLGYWNALGILAAAAACVGVGVVAHASRPQARAAAGFSLPILAGALYLTFSRGSWLALGIGLVVAILLEPRRRKFTAAGLATALPCVVVLAFGVSSHALTTPNAPASDVAADAHRLAIAVLLACAASAALAVRVPRLAVRLPHVRMRPFVAAAVVLALAAAVISVGGPARVPGAAARAFDASPPNATSNLNTHLLTLSGSWRGEMWHVALAAARAHPLAGNGAGTYGRIWLMKRNDPVTIQDAHSVYLETLAELGAVGLALLIAVLAVPLIALRGARKHPYIPVLAAAYIMFVAHAAIDWDWEMPVVTMAELVCGAAIVVAARGDWAPLRRKVRAGGVVAALVVVACTLVFLVGNRDLDAAAAANGQRTLQARAAAARTWVPWSPDPSRWLAEVQLERGNRSAARRLFAAAIAKDGSDWSLWLQMAAASSGRQRVHAIFEAIQLDPRGPEVAQTARQYGLIPRARARSRQ